MLIRPSELESEKKDRPAASCGVQGGEQRWRASLPLDGRRDLLLGRLHAVAEQVGHLLRMDLALGRDAERALWRFLEQR